MGNFEILFITRTLVFSLNFKTLYFVYLSVTKISTIPRLLSRGFMFYLCYLYLLTYTGVQHNFHIRRCSCHSTVTRLSLVEQELLALQEHLSSPSVFSNAFAARSLVFCEIFCRSLLVLLSFFFWPL